LPRLLRLTNSFRPTRKRSHTRKKNWFFTPESFSLEYGDRIFGSPHSKSRLVPLFDRAVILLIHVKFESACMIFPSSRGVSCFPRPIGPFSCPPYRSRIHLFLNSKNPPLFIPVPFFFNPFICVYIYSAQSLSSGSFFCLLALLTVPYPRQDRLPGTRCERGGEVALLLHIFLFPLSLGLFLYNDHSSFAFPSRTLSPPVSPPIFLPCGPDVPVRRPHEAAFHSSCNVFFLWTSPTNPPPFNITYILDCFSRFFFPRFFSGGTETFTLRFLEPRHRSPTPDCGRPRHRENPLPGMFFSTGCPVGQFF